jgi:hypothetical protein
MELIDGHFGQQLAQAIGFVQGGDDERGTQCLSGITPIGL